MSKQNLNFDVSLSNRDKNELDCIFNTFFENPVISVGSLLRKMPWLGARIIRSLFLQEITLSIGRINNEIYTTRICSGDKDLCYITHRCKSHSSVKSLQRVLDELFAKDRGVSEPHQFVRSVISFVNTSYEYTKERTEADENSPYLATIRMVVKRRTLWQHIKALLNLGSTQVTTEVKEVVYATGTSISEPVNG